MVGISVIIITKNESKNIRRCLESVKWADEIIVLDSGSADDTVAICKEFTPHVFSTDWPGFGLQKGRALEKATQEWVLSVDADEVVTPELKSEILKTLSESTREAGFQIPRRSLFAGKFLKHGGWGKDYVLRLVKKSASYFTSDVVHEKIIVQGVVGKLKKKMIHYSSSNLEDILTKLNLYTTLGAEQAFAKGQRSSFFSAILHAQWTFFRVYFLKGAFLDGKFGFIMAVTRAHTSFYKHIKLMQLWSRVLL